MIFSIVVAKRLASSSSLAPAESSLVVEDEPEAEGPHPVEGPYPVEVDGPYSACGLCYVGRWVLRGNAGFSYTTSATQVCFHGGRSGG